MNSQIKMTLKKKKENIKFLLGIQNVTKTHECMMLTEKLEKLLTSTTHKCGEDESGRFFLILNSSEGT